MKTAKFTIFLGIVVSFFFNIQKIEAVTMCDTSDSCCYDTIYGSYKPSTDFTNSGLSAGTYLTNKVSSVLHIAFIDEQTKTIRILFSPYVIATRNASGVWNGGSGPNFLKAGSNPIAGGGSVPAIIPSTVRYNFYEKLYVPTYVQQFLSTKVVKGASISLFGYSQYEELITNSSLKKISKTTLQIVPRDLTSEINGARTLYTYGLKHTDIYGNANLLYNNDLKTVGTNIWDFSYSAKLYSKYTSTSIKTNLATGMGINIKKAGSCQTADMAMGFYIPFYMVISYADTCEIDQADSTSDSKFTDYWTRSRSGGRNVYTPTKKMMDCTCKTNASGSTYIYYDFNRKYMNNASGGSLYIPRTVRSSNLTVDCDNFPASCSVTELKAGNLTTEQINACCNAHVAGFDSTVCNTTFDLWCENDDHNSSKLTESSDLSYTSYKNEVGDSNTACSVYCTEAANMVFANNPYVVAGQGFEYYFRVNTKRTCNATYKYTADAWVTKYNGYVNTRISKYNSYLTAKAAYEAWYCNSNGTHTHSYSCNCVTDPVTKARTCQTCHRDDAFCSSPSGGMCCSTCNSKKSSLRTTMNNAYSAYQSALSTEQGFLNDKDACNNWRNTYDINGDFNLEIEENDTKAYTYDETKTTTTSNRTLVSNTTSLTTYRCSSTATSLASCSTPSTLLYYNSGTPSIAWSRYTAYTFTYKYPEENYIDKLTGDISTVPSTDNYYGGFKYFTSLGTLTGDYNLITTMNNEGFGAYNQWKLKNSLMPCQYHLENNLGPSNYDDNYPEYGGLGLAFREVDLKDLFPAKHKTIGSNWNSERALVTAIESKGDALYSQDPKYVIVLTPDTMKSVRTYNDKYEYTDWSKFKFNEDDDTGTSEYLQSLIRKGIVKVN